MRLGLNELAQFARERTDYRKLISEMRDGARLAQVQGLQLTCIGNAGGVDNLVHGRPSGGFLLRYAGRSMIFDPGANSLALLVRLGFNPFSLTDILASHAHNDHVGNLCSAVAAVLHLGLDEPRDSHIVVCPSLVDYSAAASTKLGFMLPAFAWSTKVHALYWDSTEVTRFDGVAIQTESRVNISADIAVSAARGKHGEVSITGFVTDTPLGRFGYTGDTEYFDGLSREYQDVQVLWMNMNTLALDALDDAVPVPKGNRRKPVHNHLGYVGVCKLIEEVRPSTAIVSHLGMQLLDQREQIQALLRERFDGHGVAIYCPDNGDSFLFERSLAEAPLCGRFAP